MHSNQYFSEQRRVRLSLARQITELDCSLHLLSSEGRDFEIKIAELEDLRHLIRLGSRMLAAPRTHVRRNRQAGRARRDSRTASNRRAVI